MEDFMTELRSMLARYTEGAEIEAETGIGAAAAIIKGKIALNWKHVKIGPTYMGWADGTTITDPAEMQQFGYVIRLGDLVITKFSISADGVYEPWKHGYRWVTHPDRRPIIPKSGFAPKAWKETVEVPWIHPVSGIKHDLITPDSPMIIHRGDRIFQQQFNTTGGTVIYHYTLEYWYETI
jgi:hypothetical protein